RKKLKHVCFVITTFFLYVKDQKLRVNSHFFSVVLNSDGYSFKSSGSTTRFSTRWKFSYSVCTCSCGSDDYSSLYCNGYKQFLVPINKTSPFSSLFRNRYRNWCFFYVVYLSYWGVSGKTYVGYLSVNWWNTSHQPGSISRSGTSIHVPMLIPILSNFANSPFSTRILFVLETRLPIPSFPESPLTEEREA
ncbi:hypothetical protein Taro_010188, partial [Colocasia esculenta]|nr:hypothetical protein [Colocasia esculenta]